MKIDTLGVQAFVAIADHGSFSRAAQALHITQTGLTRRLQNLESFLGVKLVERTTLGRVQQRGPSSCQSIALHSANRRISTRARNRQRRPVCDSRSVDSH